MDRIRKDADRTKCDLHSEMSMQKMTLDQKENEMETLKRNVTRKEGEIKSINDQK